MLKSAFIAIVCTSLLSLQVHASCGDWLQRLRLRARVNAPVLKEGEAAFLARLNRLEETTNILRRLKKNKRPALHVSMGQRLAKLDSYLFVGDYATAHRELRTLFRDVEFAGLAVMALDAHLEQVRRLGNLPYDQVVEQLRQFYLPNRQLLDEAMARHHSLDGLVDELVHTRAKYEVKLGSRFQSYLLAREHLEELLQTGACSLDCQHNVQRLLDSLGVKYASDRTRFASFLQVGSDINGDILRQLIDQHRLATLARLKRERNAELFAVFREFITQPSLVQKIISTLSGIPGMHRLRLVRVFKVFLDAVAQTKHAPVINQIVRSQESAAKKLDQLLHQNSLFEGNELIINFARRSDLETKRVWNEILTASGERGEQLNKQLLEADELARARGVLELVSKETPLPRWAVLAATGAGAGYFWFGRSQLEVESAGDQVGQEEQEPRYDEIPMEEEFDHDLDVVSEELSRPDVQEILFESDSTQGQLERGPSSAVQATWWQRCANWFTELF